MKKIVTVLMLAAAVLVGGMNIEAKTTNKKSKARTTKSTRKSASNPTLQIQPSELVRKNKDGRYYLIDDEKLPVFLNSKGFKIIEYSGGSPGWIAYPTSKSTIKEISKFCGCHCIFEIVFYSSQEAKKFYDQIKKYNNPIDYTIPEQYRGYERWELDGTSVTYCIE